MDKKIKVDPASITEVLEINPNGKYIFRFREPASHCDFAELSTRIFEFFDNPNNHVLIMNDKIEAIEVDK